MPQVHTKHMTQEEAFQVCQRLGLLSGKGVQFSITKVLLLLDCRVRLAPLKCWEEPNGSVTKTQ